MKKILLVGAVVLMTASSWGQIMLGAGSKAANLVVQFGNGNEYWFEYSFSGAAITATDLLLGVELESPDFDVDLTFFGGGLGNALNGVSYLSDSNSGFTAPDGFWTFYQGTQATPTTWSSSGTGIDGASVDNGSWMGFVYGPASLQTVPEPSSVLLMIIGGVTFILRRRRQ